MNSIGLNNQLSLVIEQENKRLRLVVLENGKELVCRKTARTELLSFLRTDTSHLFRGRLQLHKLGGDILVSVKNSKAGTIHAADLEQLINPQSAVVL